MEIKNKIFGLNAAKLFGIDPDAKRQAIKTDKLTDLRRDYRQNPRRATRSTAGSGSKTAAIRLSPSARRDKRELAPSHREVIHEHSA